MMDRDPVTIVVAGNLRQFWAWCKEVGVGPRDRSLVVITGPHWLHRLNGLDFVRIEYVGDFEPVLTEPVLRRLLELQYSTNSLLEEAGLGPPDWKQPHGRSLTDRLHSILVWDGETEPALVHTGTVYDPPAPEIDWRDVMRARSGLRKVVPDASVSDEPIGGDEPVLGEAYGERVTVEIQLSREDQDRVRTLLERPAHQHTCGPACFDPTAPWRD